MAYEEFDVASDAEKRSYMIDISGQLGVPVIQINDSVVVGFDKDTLEGLLGLKA